MKATWLGHHCWKINSESGLTIITDPYFTPYYSGEVMGDFRYDPLDESADIVTISHDQHRDHSYADAIKGNPVIVRGSDLRNAPQMVHGIEFKAIPCYHDDMLGKWAGDNNIIYFEVDGIRICHNGDLGHSLTDDQLAELGKIDVLFLAVGHPGRDPVRAHFTIDTIPADMLYYQLKPSIVLPDHYACQKCTFRIAVLDEFLFGKHNVTKLDSSEIELSKDTLPETSQIIVLKSVY